MHNYYMSVKLIIVEQGSRINGVNAISTRRVGLTYHECLRRMFSAVCLMKL